MVDETGHHIGGMGKWGNCAPGCPIPPDDREVPVPKKNKGKREASCFRTKDCFCGLDMTGIMFSRT